MTTTVFRITTPQFVANIQITDDICIEAPASMRWAQGTRADWLFDYFARRKWLAEALDKAGTPNVPSDLPKVSLQEGQNMATESRRLTRRNPARENSEGNLRVLETPSDSDASGDESSAASSDADAPNEEAATSAVAEDSSPVVEVAAPAKRGRKPKVVTTEISGVTSGYGGPVATYGNNTNKNSMTKRMDLAVLSDSVMDFATRYNMTPVEALLGIQTLLEATGDIVREEK